MLNYVNIVVMIIVGVLVWYWYRNNQSAEGFTEIESSPITWDGTTTQVPGAGSAPSLIPVDTAANAFAAQTPDQIAASYLMANDPSNVGFVDPYNKKNMVNDLRGVEPVPVIPNFTPFNNSDAQLDPFSRRMQITG